MSKEIQHDPEVLAAKPTLILPKSKKNAIRISIVFALTCFSISCNTANAKLCKTITTDGKVAFMFVNDKPTKTLSGTVEKLSLCPEAPVEIVRKQVVEEYTVPNPVTTCEKAAVLSCDPEWGGLPVCTTGNLANFCGFCFVSTTDVNGHNTVTRYLNGAPYDGSKIVEGVKKCPMPVDVTK